MKLQVMKTDKNIVRNASSATPILEESSQMETNLEGKTLKSQDKRPMSPKPRNPQVIIGQMYLARILSGDGPISDDEVDDASLLLAEQNMSSPLIKLHQNVSSIFENVQIMPPTALEELKKHRGMIAMSMEPSTSTGCTQGPSHSTVKRNLGIEQEDMGDKLSHADALSFVSGPGVIQNHHDPNPNGEQSRNPEKKRIITRDKTQGGWFQCIK